MDFTGFYAAAVTPYDDNGTPDSEQVKRLMDNLHRQGVHGALLTGTNGEGPQLSVSERIAVYKAAVESEARTQDFRLIAGTGAVSLRDTIDITKAAYEVGIDAAAILPPFFYADVTEEGLFKFYETVIREAVPENQPVLLYNNPQVIAIDISIGLIARLLDAFPYQVIGMKDSSGDQKFFDQLNAVFPSFKVLVGSDKLVAYAIQHNGAGAITGSANVFGDKLRRIYDAHSRGEPLKALHQAHLDTLQELFGDLPRIASYKSLLAAQGVLTNVTVRPPLTDLTASQEADLFSRVDHANVALR